MTLTVFSQGGQIKGVVRDKLTNMPVPFVNIIVSGTTNGTVSDTEGAFEIKNITNIRDFRAMMALLRKAKYVAVDTETDGLYRINVNLLSFACRRRFYN